MQRKVKNNTVNYGGLLKVLTTVSLLSLSQAAFAQQASQPERVASQKTAEQIAKEKAAEAKVQQSENEVIVTGTRQSLASALDRRRSADAIMDSIVAEDVSDFPDKNVGEALSRITGVQLSRSFGEGAQVSIRGLEPDLNRVEINGTSVLSSSGNDGRTGEFQEIAAELIKSVDVLKGSTADTTEGGIGGTVQINLRKPLELRNRLLKATASGQYSTAAGNVTPRLSLAAGDKFLDDKLGLLVNLTYDDVETRGDLARNTEWVRIIDANGDGVRDFSPRIPRYSIWERDDERISAQFTAQYQLNENWDVFGEINHNIRDRDLTDYNFVTSATSSRHFDRNFPITVDADNNVIGFTIGDRDRNFETEQRRFQFEQTSTYINGGANYVTDNFEANLLLGRAETEALNRTNRAVYGMRSDINVNLDPDTGVPLIDFGRFEAENLDIDQTNPEHYRYIRMDWRPSIENQEEDLLKLDFDYNLENPFVSKLEFGGQYRKFSSERYGGGGYFDGDLWVPTANITHRAFHTTSRRQGPCASSSYAAPDCFRRNPLNGIDSFTQEIALPRTDIHEIITNTFGFAPESFPDYDLPGAPSGWLAPDYDALANYAYSGTPGSTLFDMSNFNLDSVRSVTFTDPRTGQTVTRDQIPLAMSESTLAAYTKVNFATSLGGDRLLDGNFGVRIVKTNNEGSGQVAISERQTADNSTPDEPRVNTEQLATLDGTVENSYTDILPSLNARIQMLDNKLSFRAGIARNIARPKLADLRPTGTCTFLQEGMEQYVIDEFGLEPICSVGNPNLQPYRAWSYDLEVAYYPNEEAEIRVGGFYKDITSFVLNGSVQGTEQIDYFGIGRNAFLRQKQNGEGAQIYGVELSAQTPFTFLPDALEGFGGQVNYTYSTADDVNLFNELFEEDLPFPGMSKHSFNATLYYTKGPINARAAYNYRTDWLISPADRSGNPVYREGEGYLDTRVSYRLNDHLSFFAEGKNLTNAIERTTAGSSVRLVDLGSYGRRFFFGASATF